MNERARYQSGFSLVEVTLALGVAAFCLIAIFGLLPVGLNSSQNATAQTGAAGILTAVAADLRATPLPANTSGGTTPAVASPEFQILVPGSTASPLYMNEAGDWSTNINSVTNPKYQVTVTLMQQPTLPTKGPTIERVVITWPAQNNGTPLGTLESIVALDRNL